MVKDEQVVRLRQLLRPSTTLKEIALQANMDVTTARKYIRLSTPKRKPPNSSMAYPDRSVSRCLGKSRRAVTT
jgi:hypothetical protein